MVVLRAEDAACCLLVILRVSDGCHRQRSTPAKVWHVVLRLCTTRIPGNLYTQKGVYLWQCSVGYLLWSLRLEVETAVKMGRHHHHNNKNNNYHNNNMDDDDIGALMLTMTMLPLSTATASTQRQSSGSSNSQTQKCVRLQFNISLTASAATASAVKRERTHSNANKEPLALLA